MDGTLLDLLFLLQWCCFPPLFFSLAAHVDSIPTCLCLSFSLVKRRFLFPPFSLHGLPAPHCLSATPPFSFLRAAGSSLTPRPFPPPHSPPPLFFLETRWGLLLTFSPLLKRFVFPWGITGGGLGFEALFSADAFLLVLARLKIHQTLPNFSRDPSTGVFLSSYYFSLRPVDHLKAFFPYAQDVGLSNVEGGPFLPPPLEERIFLFKERGGSPYWEEGHPFFPPPPSSTPPQAGYFPTPSSLPLPCTGTASMARPEGVSPFFPFPPRVQMNFQGRLV